MSPLMIYAEGRAIVELDGSWVSDVKPGACFRLWRGNASFPHDKLIGHIPVYTVVRGTGADAPWSSSVAVRTEHPSILQERQIRWIPPDVGGLGPTPGLTVIVRIGHPHVLVSVSG